MTQIILVPNVTNVNSDLLDSQLKAAAPADCYGLNLDKFGLHLVLSDTIAPALIVTLQNICLSHDPTAKTPAQQAEATGKVDAAAMLAAADTALTQLASKLATFQGTQNLANAAPLLIEVTQDLIALIKTTKYLAKRIN